MRVTSAEFVKAAVDERGWPKDGMPQVAFVGRSNVGKSSLINNLVNRKGLVKTSGTPGKTREINFFLINGGLYFVDLPGFGFARAPGRVQQAWGPMIEAYLRDCGGLTLVVFLLDIRHVPGEKDGIMQDWLSHYKIPTVHVATKADKVGKNARKAHVKAIAGALGIKDDEVIEFSAMTGEGKGRLWESIASAIG